MLVVVVVVVETQLSQLLEMTRAMPPIAMPAPIKIKCRLGPSEAAFLTPAGLPEGSGATELVAPNALEAMRVVAKIAEVKVRIKYLF